MSYLVFDMDATLAELSSIHIFLWQLGGKDKYHFIQMIYQSLLDKVYALEVSNKPLGILVPGILEVMKEAKRCKDAGKIKGVLIYSNNSVLTSLCFVRDLIHKYLKSDDLIVDLIHRGHPTRLLKGEELETAKPNEFPKTWKTLRRILIEGPAKASPSITSKDVIFVDDVLHPDLVKELPLGNYVNVQPYLFRCSFENVADIYIRCLNELNILNDKMLEQTYLRFMREYDKTIPENVTYGIYENIKHVKMLTGYNVKINTPAPLKNRPVLNSILQAFSPGTVIGGYKRTNRKNKTIRRRKNINPKMYWL